MYFFPSALFILCPVIDSLPIICSRAAPSRGHYPTLHTLTHWLGMHTYTRTSRCARAACSKHNNAVIWLLWYSSTHNQHHALCSVFLLIFLFLCFLVWDSAKNKIGIFWIIPSSWLLRSCYGLEKRYFTYFPSQRRITSNGTKTVTMQWANDLDQITSIYIQLSLETQKYSANVFFFFLFILSDHIKYSFHMQGQRLCLLNTITLLCMTYSSVPQHRTKRT